jgi:hypothetical protein
MTFSNEPLSLLANGHRQLEIQGDLPVLLVVDNEVGDADSFAVTNPENNGLTERPANGPPFSGKLSANESEVKKEFERASSREGEH